MTISGLFRSTQSSRAAPPALVSPLTPALTTRYGGRPLESRLELGRAGLAVTGPSGSGKSTLLGLIAGLDRPTAGSIVLDGVEITNLDENRLARLRRDRVGFVFQSYHLIPTLTALENVAMPLELAGRPRRL